MTRVGLDLAEHHERARLGRFAKTEREARQVATAIERRQAAENRALLQMRSCGARTRAGHPCRRKGSGRGGRCAKVRRDLSRSAAVTSMRIFKLKMVLSGLPDAITSG